MRSASPFWFGLMLLIVGALALCFVPQIQDRGLGHNSDPGPRVFPAGLAACMVAGGIGYVILGLLRCRTPQSDSEQVAAAESSGASSAHLDALILLGAIALYAAIMPWVGFSLSTAVFAGGMMLHLRVRWALALTVALALVVVIHLLFVALFKVQLPRGIFA